VLATLRQRNFALLWLAGLVSGIGNWVLLTALPYFLYERTGSTLAAGIIWISYFLPGLLLGSVAGVFVDRWDRKRTMVLANLLQAALMLLLLLVRSGGYLWLAYAVVFVDACVWQFSGPAENALLPRLVGEDKLVPANALNSLNDNLARVIGPAAGGALAGWFGFPSAALVDSASFLIAALLVSLVAAPGSPAAAERSQEPAGGATRAFVRVWRDWRGGLRLVARDRLLRGVFVVMGVSLVGDSILTALLVPFVKDVVGGGAQTLGALFTLRGVAGLLGGLVIGFVGTRVTPTRLLAASLIAVGAAFLVLVNFPLIWLVAALMLLSGPAIIGWLTSQQTLLQLGSSDEYRGRVFGAYGTTNALTLLLGSGAASALGDVVGVVPLLNVAGVLYALAGVAALLLLPARAGVERPLATPEGTPVG
jgi:predicted MFS family arabinose efflux permease